MKALSSLNSTLAACIYTGGSLCFSEVQEFLYLLLGVQRKCEDGEFQFVSAQFVFLQAGQTAADQQEMHLLSLCVCVQRCAGKSQQVPDSDI